MKITYTIPDMHCANCVMALESIEDDLPGIRRVEASYHKAQMMVDFDETRVTEAQIVQAVRNKGYTIGERR
jgi:copper chaperone CopZ